MLRLRRSKEEEGGGGERCCWVFWEFGAPFF
jgi:hypothetical protein